MCLAASHHPENLSRNLLLVGLDREQQGTKGHVRTVPIYPPGQAQIDPNGTEARTITAAAV